MNLRKNKYLGFTQFSRMEYKNLMPHNIKDKITFGIYMRNDGCISEVSAIWPTDTPPYIRVFPDSAEAIIPALDVIFKKFNNPEKFGFKDSVSADLFAKWLIEAGFEDDSDEPLNIKKKPATYFVCYHENSPELAIENGYIQKDEVKLFTNAYDVHKWVYDEIEKAKENDYKCIDDLDELDVIEYSDGVAFSLCYKGDENSNLYYSLVVVPKEVSDN